ncbi:hypothetical protein PGT21_007023, partial [Puccinia graminis f. sp. tritici]
LTINPVVRPVSHQNPLVDYKSPAGTCIDRFKCHHTRAIVSNLILPTSGRPLLSEYQYQHSFFIHSEYTSKYVTPKTHKLIVHIESLTLSRSQENSTDHITATCSLDCHAILTALCCLGSTKVPGVQPWADWMKSAGVDRSGRVLLKRPCPIPAFGAPTGEIVQHT